MVVLYCIELMVPGASYHNLRERETPEYLFAPTSLHRTAEPTQFCLSINLAQICNSKYSLYCSSLLLLL